MVDKSLAYFPVPLSQLRGILSHSWLDNGIINKPADGLLDLWQDGLRWNALYEEFAVREQEAEQFGREFTEGFSSANLVDLIDPLTKLSDDMKQHLRQKLDNIYKQRCDLTETRRAYCEALADLRSSLSELRIAWEMDTPEGLERVRKGIDRLQASATTLREVMNRIPEGVVIP